MKKMFVLFAVLAAPLAFAGDKETPKQEPGKGKDHSVAYICYETRGHYDMTCVNQETGKVLRLDHESSVDENPYCMKMEDDSFACSAEFLNYI